MPAPKPNACRSPLFDRVRYLFRYIALAVLADGGHDQIIGFPGYQIFKGGGVFYVFDFRSVLFGHTGLVAPVNVIGIRIRNVIPGQGRTRLT